MNLSMLKVSEKGISHGSGRSVRSSEDLWIWACSLGKSLGEISRA